MSSPNPDDDILDSPWHACAWQAYLEVWQATGQFPPDSEATRRRAYQLYEQALDEKNAGKTEALAQAKAECG